MNVFVTGADGFIGRHTCLALLEAEHSVTGLVRSLPANPLLSVTYVIGDVRDTPEKLASLLEGCDAVVHLVGIITEVRVQGQTFEAIHVEGTRNLVTAARMYQNFKHFVYISALGVSSDSPSEYVRTKAAAEELIKVSDLPDMPGLPYTILRPSNVLGKDGFFVQQMEALIRRPPLSPFPVPFVPVPGNGQNRFQPVFVDDLTACIVRCLSLPETIGQTYDIAGNEPVTFDELLNAFQKHLGTAKPLLHIPHPLMYVAASVLEALLPRPPITTDNLEMLKTDNVGDTEIMKQVFDVQPRGLDAILDECFPGT